MVFCFVCLQFWISEIGGEGIFTAFSRLIAGGIVGTLRIEGDDIRSCLRVGLDCEIYAKPPALRPRRLRLVTVRVWMSARKLPLNASSWEANLSGPEITRSPPNPAPDAAPRHAKRILRQTRRGSDPHGSENEGERAWDHKH